jgi:hypothetical protein
VFLATRNSRTAIFVLMMAQSALNVKMDTLKMNKVNVQKILVEREIFTIDVLNATLRTKVK